MVGMLSVDHKPPETLFGYERAHRRGGLLTHLAWVRDAPEQRTIVGAMRFSHPVRLLRVTSCDRVLNAGASRSEARLKPNDLTLVDTRHHQLSSVPKC